MNPFLAGVERRLFELHRKRPWLAKQSKVKISTINTWFTRNAYPNVLDAHAIANALETTIEALITGEEPRLKPRYEDPLIKEFCEYIEGLDRDTLLELRGYLKGFTWLRLVSGAPKPEG